MVGYFFEGSAGELLWSLGTNRGPVDTHIGIIDHIRGSVVAELQLVKPTLGIDICWEISDLKFWALFIEWFESKPSWSSDGTQISACSRSLLGHSMCIK